MIRTIVAYALCFFFVAISIQILIHILANSATIIAAAWAGYRAAAVVTLTRDVVAKLVGRWRQWRDDRAWTQAAREEAEHHYRSADALRRRQLGCSWTTFVNRVA